MNTVQEMKFLVLILVVQVYLCTTFHISNNRRCRLLKSTWSNDAKITVPLIRNKVEFFVNRLLQYNVDRLILSDIDPKLLEDNAEYLAKEGIFEQVMETRIKDANDGSELYRLQNLREVLSGYVSNERRKRAKEKISLLVLSIMTDSFEEALQKLIDR